MRIKQRFIFFILLFVIFIPASANQEQLLTVKDLMDIPPTPADFEIPYGIDQYQFGQLRLPEGNRPHPVIIVIHGGCWLAAYDLQHISPLATRLTEEGFATWSLEYRRIGNKGGGWPGTFLDVAEGADFLNEIKDEHALDLNRVIAIGHSAGGHLALWLAARHKLPRQSLLYKAKPLSIQGVVSLAGVGDLGRPEFQVLCNKAVQRLMGGKPSDQPKRYSAGSPIQLLPLGIPQILIQGDLDQLISVTSGQDYVASAIKSKDKASLKVLPNTGHFEVVVPTTHAWPEVLKAVKSLFK